MLGGVEPCIDDRHCRRLREGVQQLDIEWLEDLGPVEVLDHHGAQRLGLVHERRTDCALGVVGAAAGFLKRLQVHWLGGAHHRLDFLLVWIDLGAPAEKRSAGEALARLHRQLVHARIETDRVVDDESVLLRVIEEQNPGLGGWEDADGTLEDAVNDLLEVELSREGATDFDQRDQSVELRLDELRGGPAHLASRDRS